MTLPSKETPLYNHPLPAIEDWLIGLGCKQDRGNLHSWYVKRPTWEAEINLEIEELTVKYPKATGGYIQRVFKYSLPREDVEEGVFNGP